MLLQDSQTKLSKSEEANKKLTAELEVIKKELAEAKEQAIGMQNALAEQIAAVKTRLKGSEERNDNLQQQYSKLEGDLAAAKKDGADQLAAEKEHGRGMSAALSEQLSVAKKQLSGSREEHTSLQEKHSKLESDLVASKKETADKQAAADQSWAETNCMS